MKNYKYSFLALIFALSTASYSNAAYEFSTEDQDVCTEKCTPKTKSYRHEDEERNPLTLGACVKAALFTVGYWYYLEKVPGEIESRCGESAKKVSEVVPFVLFQKQLRAFGESVYETCEDAFNTAVRSVC